MAVAEEPFVPPALFPPKRPPNFLQRWKSLENPVLAWPATVYEGGIWKAPGPGGPVIVSDPELAAEVLVQRADAFPHGELINRLFRPVWGRGIFVTEGAEWRWQRRAAAPAFRPAQMATLAPIMGRVAEQFVKAWASGAPIDLHADMRRLTLQVLFDCALSGGEDFPDKAEASRQVDAFVGGVGKFSMADFLPMPEAWRPSTEARGGKPMAYMREQVGAMVARRRAAPAGQGDLVDLLFAAKDPETGQQMDDRLVRDNLIGFIAAGHETSAFALSWALWLVSQHPRTEQRMLAEIAAVAGDALITSEHVDQLTFTRQVIQETMRLYPGASTVARTAAETTMLAGRRIDKGQVVLIATYALHRRADIWHNPHAFDPDRFAGDQQRARPAMSYLPFGGGPRACMGAAFAMTEITTVLATLVRAIHLVSDPNRPVVIGSRIGGLISKGGMWMTPEPRQHA